MKERITHVLTQSVKRLKNNKGFSNIELVLGTLIILTLVCAIADFSKTSAADSSVSALANYVSETISEQGGLNTKAPDNYPGNYTTSATLIDNITTSMNSIGIPEDDWTLSIEGPGNSGFIEVTRNTNTGTYPYKSQVTIRLTYSNGFDLLNQNLPTELPELSRQLVRRTVTTYFERSNGSIGFE